MPEAWSTPKTKIIDFVVGGSIGDTVPVVELADDEVLLPGLVDPCSRQ